MALDHLTQVLPVLAPAVGCTCSPILLRGFPQQCLGKFMPRRVQTPRTQLGGAKNDASAGKAWTKVPSLCWPTTMHGADGTPGLCITSTPTQSQLAPMLVAAFPSWEAGQSLRHQGMYLHQGSGSKQRLLTEPGCGCNPGDPRYCISTVGGSSLPHGSWVSGRASNGVSHLPAASCTAGQHFAS